ncbi:FtsK/SpoIIIE domain-containing protein [Desulfitobacterium chlororespirans]|uniref:DNA segregation ATPase FtsK/SpoIIIE, S-DNA-T family n=1 Tax=Desulfitobacterium chlororespirans DSM 11544 TaxID=1121395 RepID=A0A1M7UPD0_9FIRM|nr:FtsK/SpoIIIE domain-containing protein [Desulfitobacterium chlororespirans]SHN84755.1 DNA segregation ATPase FtsK/SpoIIIE, S-DNA-T family [Desulfitobacterium chlororespirans DSM 11544]
MAHSIIQVDILGLIAKAIYWGLKQIHRNDQSYKVNEVIKALRLQNKDELRPLLKAKKKTESGWDLVYILPPGVARKDFEKERVYFETFSNSIVEFECKGRRLTMHIYSTGYPNIIKFNFEPSAYSDMLAPLPIGVTPSGKLIVEDMYKLPHAMCGGMTNYGKTSWLIGVMTALLLSGVKVSVIDRKGLDFPRFAPWVNLALTETETENLLDAHIQEMRRRTKILKAHSCQNYQEYREKHNDLPYLVLIVDELTQIKSKAAQEAIDDLAHLARASGISLILATQKPSGKVWDGFTDTRSMLAGALCFYVRDVMDSQIVLGMGNTRGAELPKIQGRAIWNNDTDQMVQTMYLSAREAHSILDAKVPKEVYAFESRDERVKT